MDPTTAGWIVGIMVVLVVVVFLVVTRRRDRNPLCPPVHCPRFFPSSR